MNSLDFIREIQLCLMDVAHTGEPFRLEHPVYLLGNGGSAAIASHICNDIIKNGGAAFVPDYATLSCLANDFGWERALDNWLNAVQDQNGMVILISSSGRSNNMLWASEQASMRTRNVVTLTGFDKDNELRKRGSCNFWIPSRNYGVIECCHLSVLHSLVNPG